MKNFSRKITLCTTVLIVIGGLYWKISTRRGVKYIIPHGYVGWVVIQYNTAQAPILPLENGYFLAVIPSSGLLKTATPLEERWGADQYYQLDKLNNRKRLIAYGFDKSKTMIWVGTTNGSRFMFFCGAKDQFDQREKYIKPGLK